MAHYSINGLIKIEHYSIDELLKIAHYSINGGSLETMSTAPLRANALE